MWKELLTHSSELGVATISSMIILWLVFGLLKHWIPFFRDKTPNSEELKKINDSVILVTERTSNTINDIKDLERKILETTKIIENIKSDNDKLIKILDMTDNDGSRLIYFPRELYSKNYDELMKSINKIIVTQRALIYELERIKKLKSGED